MLDCRQGTRNVLTAGIVLLTAMAARADDILIDDFEGGSYGGWKVEGKAFGDRPAVANEPALKNTVKSTSEPRRREVDRIPARRPGI